MKRLFDIGLSLLFIMLFSPIIVIVAFLVRVKLGGPVLFTQERPGFKGRVFVVKKFRTMTSQTNAKGVLLPDAERLTAFGKLLRKSSLDELPQLWNVLVGDMSFVGPRPLLMEYLALYNDEQRRRMDVRPGITGWAQVNGRNAISWPQRFALDVWYVDHQSFGLDMKIMWRTFLKFFKPSGVHQVGHVTVEKFTGNEEG